MSERFWWYAVRSTGLVSWVMLAASMFIGGLLAARLVRRAPAVRRAVGLHRHASALALVLVALHLVSLIADSFEHFSLVDVLVPFASTWRPGAVAWGIGAMYILMTVEATSLMSKRLSKRTWKLIHRASALGFASATLHLLQAGSEAQAPVIRWSAMATVMILAFLYLGRPLGLFAREPVADLMLAQELHHVHEAATAL
jgi:methionine sulfoxide reductase heme-binding subunit